MPIKHRIKSGKGVESVAYAHGHFAETVWDHAENSELREQREHMNQLLPGDVLFIPDKRSRMETAATGERHRYRRKGVPALYRLQLIEHDEPRANEPYRFVVDGAIREGQTDGDGVLEEAVPPDARKAELYVGEDETPYEIEFGALHPPTEISGVQMRLANLGFYFGETSGDLDDATQAALRQFQTRFDLDVTGEPDDATIDKIVEVHDNSGQIQPADSTDQ